VDLEASSESNVYCAHNGDHCKVGDGFMKSYNYISAFIRGNLTEMGCGKDVPLTVTGHSMGAAIAAIAMFDLHSKGWTIAPTVTFGQPRVGNKAFALEFEKAFGSSTLYRMTHYHDPVPHLPVQNVLDANAGFFHVSTEVYYAQNVSSGFKVCNGDGEDSHCADSYTNVPVMVAACLGGGDDCDHLTYLMPLKATPTDGVSCVDATSVASFAV